MYSRYVGGVKRCVKLRFVDGRFSQIHRHRPMTGIERKRFINRIERSFNKLVLKRTMSRMQNV